MSDEHSLSEDEFDDIPDNEDEWEAEEIDPYVNTNTEISTNAYEQSNEDLAEQPKQPIEWICHQCHFANKLLEARNNDYKCCNCAELLKLKSQPSYIDHNSNDTDIKKEEEIHCRQSALELKQIIDKSNKSSPKQKRFLQLVLNSQDSNIISRLLLSINDINMFLRSLCSEYINNMDHGTYLKIQNICLNCSFENLFIEGAKQLVKEWQLNEMINNNDIQSFQRNLEKTRHVDLKGILCHIWALYGNKEINFKDMKSVCNKLLNVANTNLIARFLFNIKKMDTKGLISFTWMVYINGHIDTITFSALQFICKNVIKEQLLSFDKEGAKHFRKVLQLDQEINIDILRSKLQRILHNINPEITRQLLYDSLIFYRGNDIDEIELNQLSTLLVNLGDINVMCRVLIKIKTMDINMKQLFSFIWLEFINNDVDKMSIIKLRAQFQQIQKSGQTLLEYKTNGILDGLDRDLRKIGWEKYIDSYIEKYIDAPHTKISDIVIENKENREEKMQTFLHIMHQYDEIINGINEEAAKSKYVVRLKELFEFIANEFSMSKVMDTMFELQH
eukprot:513065_1